MSDLLNLRRSRGGQFTPVATLDELWTEAESLGRIEVEHPVFKDTYRVEIMFDTKSGSSVRAKFEAPRIWDAVHGAILEARSLGAGWKR